MCCCKKRWRKEVLSVLHEIRDALRPAKAVRLVFSAQIDGGPVQKGITMLTLQDVQQVTLSIQPVDAKGNPAVLPAPPVWSASDATILTVTAATDGLSALAVAVGALGSAQVTVTAQPDVDPSIAPIVGTLDVTVVSSDAVSLTIQAGVPVVQPTPTP